MLFFSLWNPFLSHQFPFVAFIIKQFVKIVYVADDGELIICYDVDGDDGDPNKGKKSKKLPKETVSEHIEKAEPLSPANPTDTTKPKSVRISSALVPVTRLERVRPFRQWILSPPRLPFHHTGKILQL